LWAVPLSRPRAGCTKQAQGLDDEDLGDPDEISALRADRLAGIAKLIRDYVHPSHWPAFEVRAHALEQELQGLADQGLL
jgi:hypothetical protein